MIIGETNVNGYIFLSYMLPFLNEEIRLIIEEKNILSNYKKYKGKCTVAIRNP